MLMKSTETGEVDLGSIPFYITKNESERFRMDGNPLELETNSFINLVFAEINY